MAYSVVRERLDQVELVGVSLSPARLQLIGAYFTHEYSIEAAALGNPSMVVAPDQSGVEDGAVRLVMSVRAIGRVIHCGRQLATADAQLIGPDGTLYAHATTTCLVFDLQHKPAGGTTPS